MSSNKSKSAAPAERERLLPPALVLTFTAMVGVGLALMFPRETLRERLLGQGRTVDGLTVAYLEAWSRVAPDDTSFMGVLAEQYARSGRLDDAEAMLARMQAVQGADLTGPILRTRIEITQQRAYAALPDTPERAQRLALMSELLKEASAPAALRKWSLGDLQALATQSRQIGDASAAGKLYRELAVRDPAHADFYNQQLAGIALSGGNYRDAARALFEAQARSKNLYEQRTLFLQALQTLQAGNLLDEALMEAERRGGKLLDDPDVLRFLTRLALAANKPDVAAKYVERLLKLSAIKPMDATRLAQAHLRRVSDTEPWLARGHVFLDGPRGQAMRQKLADAGEFGVRHVAATTASAPASAPVATATATARAPAAPKADSRNVTQSEAQAAAKTEVAQAAAEGRPFNADDYDLAYRVFLAAGKLDQAQRVAQTAVQKLPNEPVWRERLAQVSEWNRQPMVALQSWLEYAQATNDERAWNNVMRLAPGLNDDRAYLAALRHRAAGGDLKTVDEVVAAYERLGEPEAGMAFLDGIAHGPHGREIMERNAALAERAGRDARAFELYGQLQRRYGPRPQYALKRANMLYVDGRLTDAMDAMLPARGSAGPKDLLYWRTYTELARLTQRDDLLKDGYRQMMIAVAQTQDEHCMTMPPGAARNDCLSELRDAEDRDFSNLIDYYNRSPIDAGRIAEASWRKHGKREQLELAVYYYTRAHAYVRIERLLASLTPEQKREAESSAAFMMRRAEFWRLTGDRERALADLRHAASLPDADSETYAALLWALIDMGTDSEVRAVMRRLHNEAEDDPGLWGAYAAGAMRFQDGRTALHYLRKMQQGKSADPLWLGLIADAYEAIGETSMAWRIRKQAWIDLHHAWSTSGLRGAEARHTGEDEEDAQPDDEEGEQGAPARTDLRRQVVALGQVFASGDVSRQLVIEMLRRDRAEVAARRLTPPDPNAASQLGEVPGLPPLVVPPQAELSERERRRQRQISAASREVALAWAMSSESNELARAWLARQYVRTLQRPAYAEISIALDNNDLEALDRIMERQAGRVPVTSQIEANRQLDRLAAAQTQAFETQEMARTDDALQETLQDALLTDAQAIEPRVTMQHQKPLEYFEYSLAGGARLWDGYALNLRGVFRDQRTTDRAQLDNVPASDRRAELALSYRDSQKRWALGVGRRDGLESFTTARLQGEWNREGRVSFTTLAGYNQPAEESSQLRVGGMKDVLGLGAMWRIGLREFVSGRVEYSHFYGQDRSALGHGMVYDVEAGYRIRTAYPDYTVRIVGTHANYSTNAGTLTPRMQRLLPADDDEATPGFYMPQGFTQAGVLFGFGTDLIDDYTRKWRPFAEVGALRDTRAGHNFRAQLGVAGSVLGNDHLSLYVLHETAARNGGTPLTELGLRYRWLY
ncbi:Tetratricopeptide repeat-containing protein [Cupriavidus sp. YR651]|uniref:tetratricopeptide repeat protein n=1 Tax=Cupriavidus sp. YR651 TaxID=1855315 RepID=UPI0008918235|nr:tetratricopeptide repeat protein [Cupriavidus sp. YR651]SDC75413.1 Tetratricopeptide repeat-containing protein [Cupriavidus sp. YR651]